MRIVFFEDIRPKDGKPFYWQVDTQKNTARLYIPKRKENSNIVNQCRSFFDKKNIPGIKIENKEIVIVNFNEFCSSHTLIKKQGLFPNFRNKKRDKSATVTSNSKASNNQNDNLKTKIKLKLFKFGSKDNKKRSLPNTHRSTSLKNLFSTRKHSKQKGINNKKSAAISQKKDKLRFNVLTDKEKGGSTWGKTGVYKKQMLINHEKKIRMLSELEFFPKSKLAIYLNSLAMTELLRRKQNVACQLSIIINKYICKAAVKLSDEEIDKLVPIFKNQILFTLKHVYAEPPTAFSHIEEEDLTALYTFNPDSKKMIAGLKELSMKTWSRIILVHLFLEPSDEAIESNENLELLNKLKKNLENEKLFYVYSNFVKKLQSDLISLREETLLCMQKKIEIDKKLDPINWKNDEANNKDKKDKRDEYYPLTFLIEQALTKSCLPKESNTGKNPTPIKLGLFYEKKNRNTTEGNSAAVLTGIIKNLVNKLDDLDPKKCVVSQYNQYDINGYVIKRESDLYKELSELTVKLAKQPEKNNNLVITEFTNIITKNLALKSKSDGCKNVINDYKKGFSNN